MMTISGLQKIKHNFKLFQNGKKCRKGKKIQEINEIEEINKKEKKGKNGHNLRKKSDKVEKIQILLLQVISLVQDENVRFVVCNDQLIRNGAFIMSPSSGDIHIAPKSFRFCVLLQQSSNVIQQSFVSPMVPSNKFANQALDFDLRGILSCRSPVLTLRFSLKIKSFAKQNMFYRSDILHDFSISCF